MQVEQELRSKGQPVTNIYEPALGMGIIYGNEMVAIGQQRGKWINLKKRASHRIQIKELLELGTTLLQWIADWQVRHLKQVQVEGRW
jgi:hypothetical protein